MLCILRINYSSNSDFQIIFMSDKYYNDDDDTGDRKSMRAAAPPNFEQWQFFGQLKPHALGLVVNR
jgi:hypothetical protein